MSKESPQKKDPKEEPKQVPKQEPGKKHRKHHHTSRILHNSLTVLFVLLVCVVFYLIYHALHTGSEFPVMAVGKVVTENSETQLLPTEFSAGPEDITVPTREQAAGTESSAPETEPAATETEPSTEASSAEEPSKEEATEAEPSTEPLRAPEELVREQMKAMTLEDKIWQMLFLSPGQMKGRGGKQQPAGAVYFSPGDLTDKKSLPKTMDSLQNGAEIPLLMGVTEEGGSMAPLNALGLTEAVDPMSAVGAAGDAGKAEEIGRSLGSQLKEAGFHFNLAPLADVVTNFYNPALGDRPFSASETVTAEMVSAMVKGLQDSGTAACLKHFPDFGSAAEENNRFRTYRLLTQLQELELVPFQAGIDAGAEMVLVSNMAAPGITGNNDTPCSMDRDLITGCLREEMGFGGIVLSDFQNEDYITSNYNPGEAAVNAVSAGCDALLLPPDPDAAVKALLDAVKDGTLTESRIEESVSRILLLKARCGLIGE